MNKKLLALLIGTAFLYGCDDDSSNSGNAPKAVNTKVGVYTSVENCSTAADVPNCAFNNGVYVLNIDASVTAEQQQRVVSQVNDMLGRASDEVRQLFAQKRVVLGIMQGEPTGATEADEFVVELADSIYGSAKVIDAIELIYTDMDGNDETTKTTTYQKLMQLFDYYIDLNSNSAPGSELATAYAKFKEQLTFGKITQDLLTVEYLQYDECNYGNGQLGVDRAVGTPVTCPIDSEDDPDGSGSRDPIHRVAVNLNPGALFGTAYEYMRDPGKNTPAGELNGSEGTAFSNTGNIGSSHYAKIDWSNSSFKPIEDYLNKWFFTK